MPSAQPDLQELTTQRKLVASVYLLAELCKDAVLDLIDAFALSIDFVATLCNLLLHLLYGRQLLLPLSCQVLHLYTW